MCLWLLVSGAAGHVGFLRLHHICETRTRSSSINKLLDVQDSGALEEIAGAHHYTNNTQQSACVAITAGTCDVCSGRIYYEDLLPVCTFANFMPAYMSIQHFCYRQLQQACVQWVT